MASNPAGFVAHLQAKESRQNRAPASAPPPEAPPEAGSDHRPALTEKQLRNLEAMGRRDDEYLPPQSSGRQPREQPSRPDPPRPRGDGASLSPHKPPSKRGPPDQSPPRRSKAGAQPSSLDKWQHPKASKGGPGLSSAHPHGGGVPLNALSQPTSARPPQIPGGGQVPGSGSIHSEAQNTDLLKQPDTKPISQEQLVAEVKGIYAGLVMVESKCIEIDNEQSQADASQKLTNDQWQALIALHRTLLHEHHDFFLASQHPSASQALRRLASKYAMPARMWRHGIHSFLELLRHRLPHSLEHMLAFIYLAYSMMALLFETVPAFEDTWIECLGDLSRYRMAIEDEDLRDREIWTGVSRHWYSKASDKAPTTGRLYHHLAILARPHAVSQLYYYTKSLCVPIPFPSARESIHTLFDPIMAQSQHRGLAANDSAFVAIHAALYCPKYRDRLDGAKEEYFTTLDLQIGRQTKSWMETGHQTAITNCNAVIGYGTGPVMQLLKPNKEDGDPDTAMTGVTQALYPDLDGSIAVMSKTSEVVYRRFGDPNILPYLHVTLVFIHFLTFFPAASVFLEASYPWKLLALMLNTLLVSFSDFERIEGEDFPRGELSRPLPDDYALRGLFWVDLYFPNDWFSSAKVDDDERYFEVLSMTEERKERILWLACQIAKAGRCLTYANRQFSVVSEYDVEIGPAPFAQSGEPLSPEEAQSPSTFSATSQPFTVDDNDDFLDTAMVS